MKQRKHRFVALSATKHAYVPDAMAAHPRFEPVVVADDSDNPQWVHDRNEEYAEKYNVPYVKDVGKAIADFDVDVAVVSSEAERHCDLSVRAANAGLHIVQDKPMSTRLSECDRVVEAVRRNNVRFLMWNRNYLPALIQARDAIEAGKIGTLQSIHVDFYFAKDAGPPKQTRKTDGRSINWMERQLEAHKDGSDGGVGTEPMGELAIEGIYPLGYVRLLTGAEVTRVFARTATHFHQANVDNNVEDLATVTLEMERDIVGSLCIGRIGAASHPDIGEIKLHMIGSDGALVVTEARPEVAVYYRNQPATEFKNQRIASDNNFLLAEDFAQAIDSDGETILNAEGGRAICATVMAALESAKSGRPVTPS